MTGRAAFALLFALLLATGCAMGPKAAPAPFGVDPQGPAPAAAQRFAAEIDRAFRPGADVAASARALEQAGFRCVRSTHTLGDPPSRVCRRALDRGECRHTWQVFFYEGPPTRLAKARPAYDRACGPDPLLGAGA